MSELAEFLLARIADDEAAAGRYALPEAPDGFVLEWMTLYQGGDSALTVSSARVLAECEAKRRIVALFPHRADGDGWNNAGEEVLCLLALPYADHPDYRKEWKA